MDHKDISLDYSESYSDSGAYGDDINYTGPVTTDDNNLYYSYGSNNGGDTEDRSPVRHTRDHQESHLSYSSHDERQSRHEERKNHGDGGQKNKTLSKEVEARRRRYEQNKRAQKIFREKKQREYRELESKAKEYDQIVIDSGKLREPVNEIKSKLDELKKLREHWIHTKNYFSVERETMHQSSLELTMFQERLRQYEKNMMEILNLSLADQNLTNGKKNLLEN